MARPLIERALEVVEEESKKGGIPRVVLGAPTGYGKSIAAPLFASTLVKQGLAYSFIHSLPLRTIVRDIYLCLLVNSLRYDTKLREICQKSEEVLKEVSEALRSAGIDSSQIAYQMGEEIEGERKEPLFGARYVVTTLDSLAYNAFRIPLTEIFNPRKHYAIPRLRIFLSALYLDEAHAVYEEEDDLERVVTVFSELLKTSAVGKIPTVIASATLSKDVENHIRSELGHEVKLLKLWKRDTRKGNVVYVRDADFEDFAKSITWKTGFISEKDLVSRVKELVETGLRVFVARDTICSAIDTYKSLKDSLNVADDEIALLHSLMSRQDKEKAFEKLEGGRLKVLVATSIIEAGVDISFDALVTDGGRPASIVQRTGRVCRTPSTCRTSEVSVYLIRNKYLVAEVEEFVKSTEGSGRQICWRLPYNTQNRVSYVKLINSVRKHINVDNELARKLRALTNPLYVSSTTINKILDKMKYALLRTHLTEVLVGENELLRQDRDRLRAGNMVISFSKLPLLVERGCIEGLYVALDSGIKMIDQLNTFKLEKAEAMKYELLKRYLSALRELARDNEIRHRVLKIFYLLKESCYVKGEGVDYGVLCLQRRGN